MVPPLFSHLPKLQPCLSSLPNALFMYLLLLYSFHIAPTFVFFLVSIFYVSRIIPILSYTSPYTTIDTVHWSLLCRTRHQLPFPKNSDIKRSKDPPDEDQHGDSLKGGTLFLGILHAPFISPLILSLWVEYTRMDGGKRKNMRLMLVEMTLYRSSSGVGVGHGEQKAIISISWNVFTWAEVFIHLCGYRVPQLL